MKVAVLDCYSGIAGDMTVGAFLDAGFDFKLLRKELSKLSLRGVRLEAKKTVRNGISATKFQVLISEKPGCPHTAYPGIEKGILRSRLSKPVKEISLRIFRTLAQAEGKVHGKAVRDVALHEVGALDALADIVGTAVCLDRWNIKKVFVRNLHTGRGVFKMGHHGKMMNPPPATLELLRGFEVRHSPVAFEMITPTGAAILSAMAEKTEDLPSVQVERIGYGAGTRDFRNRANVLRLTVGETGSSFHKDRVLVLETNIDDMNPLGFETLYSRLFRAGVLDVFVMPVLMKKMRPAYKLSVLFELPKKEAVSRIVFQETPTLGVRFLEVDRLILERKKFEMKTKYGKISVKTGLLDDRTLIASPEYEDCKKIAFAKKLPFRKVYEEAREKALKQITRS